MAFGRRCGSGPGQGGCRSQPRLDFSSLLSKSTSRSRQGSDVAKSAANTSSGQLSLPHPATARSDLGCGNGVHRGLWRKR